MKVLVTGAGGLIGGAAARAFHRAGMAVISVTRRRMPTGEMHADVLDLANPDAAQQLASHKPDLIVHAAAVLPPAYLGEAAQNAATRNRAIDDAVLTAAASAGCRLVYLSGTSLYGCVQTLCTEESAVTPRGPYLEQKLRSEERCLTLREGVVLRVSSPYGELQQTATVLLRFVRQATRGEDLLYYGHGLREQDFIAVDDISAAVLNAGTRSHVRGIFNIASGQPITMKDLATIVIDVTGSSGSRARAAGVEDPEETCRARIDITKARRELQWVPIVDLRTGIQRLASSAIRNAGLADPSLRRQ